MQTATDTVRLLDAADFSFHGFNELMDHLQEWLRDVGIRSGDPAVAVADECIYVPSERVPAANRTPGRFIFQGGLIGPDGQPVEAALSRRRGSRWGERVLGEFSDPVLVEPEAELDEEVVYLGWYFGHFGHFLLESVSRTWFLDQVDPSVKVVFHTMRHPTPSGTTLRILEDFGVPLERMLFLDKPTRLRRAIIPEPLYELSCQAHELMPRRYREIASRITGDITPSDQPLYLSRRLLPSNRRRVVGEFELEEALRENGFRIAYPETMSIDDQIRMVNQHRDILTSAGSAAYVPLFAQHGPRMHIMTDGVPRRDYFLIPAVIGAEASYINCLGGGNRPSINTSPLLAQLDILFAYLETRGLLTKRTNSGLARTIPTLQAEYDESWIYASVRDVPRNEELSPEVRQQALNEARTSWPVCWALAQHLADREPPLVNLVAEKFVELAAAESRIDRLFHYHKDISSSAVRVVRGCTPEVARMVTTVLLDRFQIVPTEKQDNGTGPKAKAASHVASK